MSNQTYKNIEEAYRNTNKIAVGLLIVILSAFFLHKAAEEFSKSLSFIQNSKVVKGNITDVSYVGYTWTEDQGYSGAGNVADYTFKAEDNSVYNGASETTNEIDKVLSNESLPLTVDI